MDICLGEVLDSITEFVDDHGGDEVSETVRANMYAYCTQWIGEYLSS